MDGPARERLAVALDVPDLDAAGRLIARLEGVPGWLKVGSELFTAVGPAAVAAAAEAARVFLDLKFHDIPNTVAHAVAAATRQGVSLLTVHAAGGAEMLKAAREAAEDEAARRGLERPALAAVTVLTSLTPADLKELGYGVAVVQEQVARLVDLALAARIDAVVVSPREAALVRRRAGAGLAIVTPGVRPSGWPQDDQARTAGAADAVAAGADLLVVGRPVAQASSPARAARALLREIEDGLAARPA
jgi:orotidine-5'-phosphate decarboxylase